MKQKDDRRVLHLMTTGRITTNEHCDCCIWTHLRKEQAIPCQPVYSVLEIDTESRPQECNRSFICWQFAADGQWLPGTRHWLLASL